MNTFDHSTNMMWTPLVDPTLCWALVFPGREGPSLCLGVDSFVGEENHTTNTPHASRFWRWNWASDQSGLGCVVDICSFCLLIIILPSGDNISVLTFPLEMSPLPHSQSIWLRWGLFHASTVSMWPGLANQSAAPSWPGHLTQLGPIKVVPWA